MQSAIGQIPKLFAERFPITTITFQGHKFRKQPFIYSYKDVNETIHTYTYDYQQVNKKNQTVNQYIKY
jgi:hypothetical protein